MIFSISPFFRYFNLLLNSLVILVFPLFPLSLPGPPSCDYRIHLTCVTLPALLSTVPQMMRLEQTNKVKVTSRRSNRNFDQLKENG